ncbi:MAG TPA: hypothetical protein VGF38_01915 [Ktedonobacterales bacterium]|jgi:hypothetical protein
MNTNKSANDDPNSSSGSRLSPRDNESHRLAREWGLVATEQLRLAQALQERADEERTQAIRFEQSGDSAKATAARTREDALLLEAEANLRKAQEALLAERKWEGQEDLSIQAAEIQIRLHMPDILPACWSLANAVKGSTEINPIVQDNILRLYEAFVAGLASLREDRSLPRILEELRGFVQAAHGLETPDIVSVWEHHKNTLGSFL